MTEDNVRERIKKVLKEKKTSFTAIANGRTAVQGRFQRQLKDASITCDTLLEILKAFPDIDANWLMTGQGPMIKVTGATSVTHPGTNYHSILQEESPYSAQCNTDNELARALQQQAEIIGKLTGLLERMNK